MSLRPFYDEQTKLYWLLKGRTEQGIPERLKVGEKFTLEKTAPFNYPTGQVLLVCNDDFDVLAYAKVLSFEQEAKMTRVRCQIAKTLNSEEQQALTTYLRTTQQLMKEST
jgi:hypothetical protein